MERNFITRVNGVEIFAMNDAEKLVPIKPICEALGVDHARQVQKIKDDEDLGSVIGLAPTTKIGDLITGS